MSSSGSGYCYRLTEETNSFRLNHAILIAFALIMTVFNTANAAYLKNVPVKLRQPDQTVLYCFATGDEYHHWLHDAKNFTIVQDSVTGYYVYAIKSGNNLASSGFIAGKTDPSLMGLQPGINLDAESVQTIRRNSLRVPALKGSYGVMTTGTINNIVIFIRFSDQSEYTEPLSKYYEAFNATGTVSMMEYFKEVSGSQLTINTKLYPQAGGATVVSYQDTKTRAYYCKYNQVTNPSGYQNDTERSDREMSLLRDATLAMKSQIEASGLNFDADGNGQVDNVCYIVQGTTDGWADLLWPHMWALYGYDVSIGGARVWNYNFQTSETFGIGVLCHEMGHSLGFPDLYRYCDNSINPVGPWDVMASTANPPQHPGIYMKHKYGGWISDIPAITTDGNYTLRPLSSDPFAGYRINSPNSTSEYFVVEYRKLAGRFESQLLGSGLIITRVSPSVNGNSFGPPDEVYVFRPDGTTTVDGDLAQANFSSNEGRTTFGGNSSTACFLSNGSPGGFRISNIGTAGESISFTVSFGEEAPPVLSVTPLVREVNKSPGTASFSVSNTGEGSLVWNATLTSGTNWAHISSGSQGSNAGTIEVSFDSNTSDSPRTATISVTTSNGTGGPKTLTLTQAGSPAILNVLPTERTLDSEAVTFDFTVSNTGGGTLNWTATANDQPTWFRITSGTNGSNNGLIQVSADANTGNTPRYGSITITTSTQPQTQKTVTFTQSANPGILNVLPAFRLLASIAATTTFEVRNSGGGEMNWTAEVTSGSDWIEIVSASAGVNSGIITLSTPENTDNDNRSGSITIKTTGSTTSSLTVYVEQEGGKPVLSVSPENCTVDCDQSYLDFEVVNLGSGMLIWDAFVTTGSGWTSIVEGTNGTGQGNIRVRIDANPENQFRESTIRITDAVTGENPRTLTIIQAANKPKLQIDRSLTTVASKGGKITFQVENTGGGNMLWSADLTSGCSWAHISSGSTGLNKGTVTVEIQPNYNNQRITELIITADEATGMQASVQITQEAKIAEIEIDPDIQYVDSQSGFVTFGVSKTGFGTIQWKAELTEGQSWARISEGSDGQNDGKILVEVDENSDTPRTATITVSSPDSAGFTKVLTIRQDIASKIVQTEVAGNFTVFPNPTSESCTVRLDSFDNQPSTLDIFNMMGQLESTRTLVNQEERIDISALPLGVYIFRISSGNNEIRQSRVIKN